MDQLSVATSQYYAAAAGWLFPHAPLVLMIPDANWHRGRHLRAVDAYLVNLWVPWGLNNSYPGVWFFSSGRIQATCPRVVPSPGPPPLPPPKPTKRTCLLQHGCDGQEGACVPSTQRKGCLLRLFHFDTAIHPVVSSPGSKRTDCGGCFLVLWVKRVVAFSLSLLVSLFFFLSLFSFLSCNVSPNTMR